MACFHPMRGWKSRNVNESGKRSVVFDRKAGFDDMEVVIPCGQCWGCRLERSRQWAIRCVHEASLYENNCFLTLTYDNEYLPEGGSLHKPDFQKFMKRLRKRFPGHVIRYFQCGEYGEKTSRPHYHACLFNFDFEDKIHFKTVNENRYYTSSLLSELWPMGHHVLGDVSFDSAAYVARYIMKKITGDKAEAHYQGKEPEYTTMSRRPGIATGWFEKYQTDIYPSDFIVLNGTKMRVPKFYDNILDRLYPHELQTLKARRKKALLPHEEDLTSRRLFDRETCQIERAKLLTRDYERQDEQ